MSANDGSFQQYWLTNTTYRFSDAIVHHVTQSLSMVLKSQCSPCILRANEGKGIYPVILVLLIYLLLNILGQKAIYIHAVVMYSIVLQCLSSGSLKEGQLSLVHMNQTFTLTQEVHYMLMLVSSIKSWYSIPRLTLLWRHRLQCLPFPRPHPFCFLIPWHHPMATPNITKSEKVDCKNI